jgi:4-diphosphocytidyl-2-C-methyl-D-erythritol kinase
MITIKAPAKINLILEVLGKRTDGFHEIRSVLQTIDLYDTLYIEAGRGFSFECDIPDWSAEKSLVSRVLSLLPAISGRGVDIKLEKHIPMMSGLGGDSSDAAALLKGLNDCCGLNISDEKLHELATQLGADVAFFLRGGTALASGKGEMITPLPPLLKMWLVLVMPDVPVAQGKTTRMYAALKPSSYSDGAITGQLVEALKKGKTIGSELLYNSFEDIAQDMYPGLSYYISGFIRSGIPAHLAGAGPALFAVFSDKAQAEDFYKICQDQHVTAHIAESI